ncbi:hypothetical protein [Prochlorococcus sp. MIT 1341]|uniref:hypothetical protein n=1 Tax=Prochlorococcus sp. MIT 1341 TaxID=3096221 RepID=UPI002A761AF5|nr:hypothetical protein [Prochlorococcus sp. MIT 1341]
MAHSKGNSSGSTSLSSELNAEQALGLIGLGLMQKISKNDLNQWSWSEAEEVGKADLSVLRQRLELTALAIDTGAPLSTAEVSQLLGAKPGSSKTQRGGLIAKRISRNVWKLLRSEQDSSHWRN